MGKVAIFLPPSFPPLRFPPREPGITYDVRKRQYLFREVAKKSGIPFTEIPLSLDLIHEARKKAEEIHGKEMVRRLVQWDLFLKDEESLFPFPDERTSVQKYAAVEAFLDGAAAIKAAKQLIDGEETVSIVTARPSHHALERPAGYCFLNKMLMALSYINEHQPQKTAIIGLDAHFDNGDAEYLLKNPIGPLFSLGFDKIYQSDWFDSHPLTPEQQRLIHFARLQPGISKEEYLQRLNQTLEEMSKFEPKIFGVNLGFDTDPRDPVTQSELEGKLISQLTPDSYREIGSSLVKTANKIGAKILILTEGGYDVEHGAMAEDFQRFLDGIKEGLL